MSEQLNQDDFEPYVPVYGAYPIPAVLEELDPGVIPKPEHLFYHGEKVVEQIVRAAIDKPTAVSDSHRMENYIPLATPQNILILRTSHERRIKRDPEVSREITDSLTFEGLSQEGGTFDRIKLSFHSTEHRGGKNTGREIRPESWYIYFYKPGEEKPSAEVFKAPLHYDSYIEVMEGEKRTMYVSGMSAYSGRARPLETINKDCPELIEQLETAIKDAQFAILEPMLPAISIRDIVSRRSALLGFRDPHTRHIGRIARLSDRIIERRYNRD